MRKLSQERRKNSFINTHHVNQILLPDYNALHDPYLTGFFDNTAIRKHLRKTGVLKKRRKTLHKLIEEYALNQNSYPLTSRPATQRAHIRGFFQTKLSKQQDLRLPSVQNQQKDKDKTNQHTKRPRTSHKQTKRQIHS